MNNDKELEEAIRLSECGEGKKALEKLSELAEKGCTYALANIGALFARGCGDLERCDYKAVDYYLKSVKLFDDSTSRLGLIRLYLQNDTLDPDKSLAKRHLNYLASQDNMSGFFGLGLIYHYGLGVSEDLDKARHYYLKAIEHGHVKAKIELLLIDPEPTFLRTLTSLLQYRILRLLDPNNPKLGLI